MVVAPRLCCFLPFSQSTTHFLPPSLVEVSLPSTVRLISAKKTVPISAWGFAIMTRTERARGARLHALSRRGQCSDGRNTHFSPSSRLLMHCSFAFLRGVKIRLLGMWNLPSVPLLFVGSVASMLKTQRQKIGITIYSGGHTEGFVETA